MEYLEARGLGDDVYGYRLFANGAPTPGPVNNPEQVLPWINIDEIVVRLRTGRRQPRPIHLSCWGCPACYSLMTSRPAAKSSPATS